MLTIYAEPTGKLTEIKQEFESCINFVHTTTLYHYVNVKLRIDPSMLIQNCLGEREKSINRGQIILRTQLNPEQGATSLGKLPPALLYLLHHK